jgi:REP element-mobilizing transposase RayT
LRSRSYADVNSAELVGVARRAISEGTQFAQIAESEFGILSKRYWGQHLSARGYWVASSGNVTDEVWVEYIKNQTPPEADDNSV